ncbi:MAG: alpha/beta hydrolase [Phycisphaerales bacterium]|nr:alpha/beta hydrolase [Phycisphaerales bacterium]
MTRLAQFTFVVLVLIGACCAAAQIELFDEQFAYDEEAPHLGVWAGAVTFDEQSLSIAIRIEADDDGTPRALCTFLEVLALNAPAKGVREEDGALRFSPTGMTGRGVTLTVHVNDNGQRLTGTCIWNDREGSLLLGRRPTVDECDTVIFLGGTIELPVMSVEIPVAIGKTPGGHWVGYLNVPLQSVEKAPMHDVHYDGVTLTAKALIGGDAAFDVAFDEAADEFAGTWNQSGQQLPFSLTLLDAPIESGRPQDPTRPYPYRDEDVTIEHPAGHTLAGTLTIPEGEGPHPVVVLITGSGPQDRDESLLGHRPFLVVSDYLTRHGIAVLRYDDRGTAESTGNFADATSADFATDALAAVHYLIGLGEIDAHRIGLMGHSEGGIIAPMVAVMSEDVSFIVLLAGTGVDGAQILLEQGDLIGRATGENEEVIKATNPLRAALYERIATDADEDTVREAILELLTVQRSYMTEEELAALPEEEVLLSRSLAKLTTPWFKFFLSYDPREKLREVTIPVLAVAGSLDLQVPPVLNMSAIEAALAEAGNEDVTTHVFEGLNHLFQKAETGSPTEYASIDETFNEQALAYITTWIREHVGLDGSAQHDD